MISGESPAQVDRCVSDFYRIVGTDAIGSGGKPIMLDGRIAAGEWTVAKMIPLGNLATPVRQQE